MKRTFLIKDYFDTFSNKYFLKFNGQGHYRFTFTAFMENFVLVLNWSFLCGDSLLTQKTYGQHITA